MNQKNKKSSEQSTNLRAPFPWFGGKSLVSSVVWKHFGPVKNYVEPFFGSGAVLLGRPHPPGIETVNDIDGLVCNFWRSVSKDPHSVAKIASSPINENEMHARHIWLRGLVHDLDRKLEGDPEYFDVDVAGWWVWGICLYIGGGWCNEGGEGPWFVVDGKLVKSPPVSAASKYGVRRKIPFVSGFRGIHREEFIPNIKRQVPHISNSFSQKRYEKLLIWMEELQDRLRRVRVCCGDWSRVVKPSVTKNIADVTGVFLDPPYDMKHRENNFYRSYSNETSWSVLDWCLENGGDSRLRIALCGYEGEHSILESQGWSVFSWRARGGYANRNKNNTNRTKERIWFSPHCLSIDNKKAESQFFENCDSALELYEDL